MTARKKIEETTQNEEILRGNANKNKRGVERGTGREAQGDVERRRELQGRDVCHDSHWS
jgi:hypothetical protein